MGEHDGDEAGLDEFICFAIYSANLAFTRVYRPLLEGLGVTYVQYIVLVALWERDGQNVGELCERLFLTTSTLAPVLQKLERMGFVDRRRGSADERKVLVSLTGKGAALREQAGSTPACVAAAAGMDRAEMAPMIQAIAALRGRLIAGADPGAARLAVPTRRAGRVAPPARRAARRT